MPFLRIASMLSCGWTGHAALVLAAHTVYGACCLLLIRFCASRLHLGLSRGTQLTFRNMLGPVSHVMVT